MRIWVFLLVLLPYKRCGNPSSKKRCARVLVAIFLTLIPFLKCRKNTLKTTLEIDFLVVS
jgi:hypothetical protein